MTDATLQATYNAHEWAEDAALDAIERSLESAPIEALACLCDTNWNWRERSFLSESIIEAASEVLNQKLERMVAA